MKALVYSDWNTVEVKDTPVPVPLENEALLKVESCGICGSEIETFRTRNPRRTPPLILGHEFCGVIESIKKRNKDLYEGQKVVVNSVISCGKCHRCQSGQTNLCMNRKVFGMNRPGAIAEYVTVPIDFLYPRPENLDPVCGALTEPAANCVHLIRKLPNIRRPKIAIIGSGTIGLIMLQTAIALKSADVLIADLNEDRLREAAALGARVTLKPTSKDFCNSCFAFSESEGVDICIDAVGTLQTKSQSIQVVHPGGTIAWIGLFEDTIDINSYEVILPEKQILGSYGAVESDYKLAVELLDARKVKGGDWVKLFPLEEAANAFLRIMKAAKNDVKAVIVPDQ